MTSDGRCNILSIMDDVQTYEENREDILELSSNIIEWRGGKYQVLNAYLTRLDVEHGNIYDFKYCNYLEDCEDENIIRFKHNNRPVGF